MPLGGVLILLFSTPAAKSAAVWDGFATGRTLSWRVAALERMFAGNNDGKDLDAAIAAGKDVQGRCGIFFGNEHIARPSAIGTVHGQFAFLGHKNHTTISDTGRDSALQEIVLSGIGRELIGGNGNIEGFRRAGLDMPVDLISQVRCANGVSDKHAGGP